MATGMIILAPAMIRAIATTPVWRTFGSALRLIPKKTYQMPGGTTRRAGWLIGLKTGMGPALRAILVGVGLSEAADIFIPGDFFDTSIALGRDNPTQTDLQVATGGHPSVVVKSWRAPDTDEGVPFVRLQDGRIGAFSKKKGTWKYWRPKKPIIMYSGGTSDLKTLLKADAAAERQLRKLKKAIDRRFPARRPRTARASTVVSDGGITIEGGPGHVIRKG